MSMRELAATAGIARASAYNRVERLTSLGIIRGFTIDVDPERVGLSLAAIVQVRVQQRSWKSVRKRLQAMPEVERAWLVSGDSDVIVLARTSDPASLRDIVLEQLQAMPEVLSTSTSIVFDEFSS